MLAEHARLELECIDRMCLNVYVPVPQTGAGVRHDVSVLQADFALTQVFDRPVQGRVLFEEVMRERNLARIFQCAVQRCTVPVGANPTRQVSFQPVAIGTAAEATKRSKLPMKKGPKGTQRAHRP